MIAVERSKTDHVGFLYSDASTRKPRVSTFSQEDIEKQDAPDLRTEELINDKGRWKLELGDSLSVTNQDKTVDDFEIIQTREGEFVDVPVALGASESNSLI